MKTYKDLKEWVGESSTENLEESWVGFGIPNLDSPAIARNPGDSVDTADFSVENSNVIEKLNTFLQSLCQRQYINPYYLINDIWKKLSLVGLNFNMRDVTFPSVEGRSIVPISSYGGRYGVLGDPTSYVSSDDGTRIPGGLNLVITFQKNGGVYTMEAHLERGIDTAPFVEAASPVSEAADYLADTRKNEYPFGSGDSIHRLGIHHGRATFHPSTKQWHHTDRPKWFHGTPQLKTGNREDLHRKVIDQGERLYGLKKSVTESIEVRYASPKDALGNSKPGWYIIDNGQYAGRYGNKEAAEHNANALRKIRHTSVKEDDAAEFQANNDAMVGMSESKQPKFNYILHHPGHPQHGTFKTLYADQANDANRHAKENGENRVWIKQPSLKKK